MFDENKAYDLVKISNATLKNEKLVVPHGTSAEIIEELRAHKEDIIEYLSGYCFLFQVSYMDKPAEWVVLKTSAIADVSYPAEEIFSGTAHEVDVWCEQHKDDPLFFNEYTSKYSVCHR